MPINGISSKEHILKSALELFALNGYAGTTIQDIVKKADVNVSMISYYFGGKDGLFLACVEHSSECGMRDIERLLVPVKTKEEFETRFSIFIEDFIRSHRESEFETLLIQREFLNPSPIAKKFIERTLPKMLQSMESFFKTAQDIGILKSDINISLLPLILMSSLVTITGEPELIKLATKKGISDPVFVNNLVSNLIQMIRSYYVTV